MEIPIRNEDDVQHRDDDTAVGDAAAAGEPHGRGGKKRKKGDRRLEEARREAAENYDRLLRLQAEFENYKKRQRRESEEQRRTAAEGVLREILPVLDNLERAVRHSDDEAGGESLVEGVNLVIKQLLDVVGRFGVEPIGALGEQFDPHVHEAMSRVDTDGDPPDGTVVEEYQKGYLLKGKVLRPAMVGVAKLANGEEEA